MNQLKSGQISGLRLTPGSVANVRLVSLVVPATPRINQVALAFEVTLDEEYVHLRMSANGHSVDLGERGHNYLLLTLARRRIADAAAGHAETSCGWMYRDELTRDPTMPAPILNLHIFRIRQQFAATSVEDPKEIVERRRQSAQLRIGTSHLSVVSC